MRSSIILGALCATLAIATPVLKKKAIVTDIVTEIVYVTITDGVTPTSSSTHKTIVVTNTKVVEFVPSISTSSSSSTTPPSPPPTSTTPPPPPPPAPTTSTTPVIVAPAPTPKAASQAATSPAAVAAPASSNYQSTALYHHNVHRANHSASALTWDAGLAASSLVVANTCVFAHKMDVNGGNYGQNLAAYGVSSGVDKLNKATLVADAITNQWYYGEVGNMQWGTNNPDTNGPEFLHFTQVVWKSSSTVGCSTVTCPAGSIFSYASLYTVCNYKSAGNMMGEFEANVGPTGHQPAVTATIS